MLTAAKIGKSTTTELFSAARIGDLKVVKLVVDKARNDDVLKGFNLVNAALYHRK